MRRNIRITLIACFIATILSCSNSTGNNKSEESDNNKIEENRKDRRNESTTDKVEAIEFKLVAKLDFENAQSIMVYYKKENETYTYYMDGYPTYETMELAEFKDSPLDIIWEKESSIIYFVNNGGIYSCDYKSDSKNLTKICDVPYDSSSENSFVKTWVDKETENISIAYKIPVSGNKQELLDKISELDKDFEFVGYAEIISIFQLSNEGNWQTILEKVVNSNPYGSSMLMVYDYVNESSKYFTSSDILESCTYPGSEMPGFLFDTEASEILKENTLEEGAAISVFRLNDKTNLITTIIWGDTPHFAPPLYLQETSSGELEEINSTSNPNGISYNQLGIQFSINYFIISNEYSNSDAIVFSKENLEVIKEYKGCSQLIEIE